MKKELLVSRIKTPDGTILTSKHVHDYVCHDDVISKEHYMLDGGSEYQRTSLNLVKARDVSVYTDSPFEEIREHLCRGTLDENGNLIWIPLKDMTTQHLFNCILYHQNELKDNEEIDKYKLQYIREIAYRYNKD